MILHVFDDAFVYRGRIETWINMTWGEEYRDEGKFTLITYDTEQYAALMRRGWYYYRADRPVAMMAVRVERDTDKNTITVNGYTPLHLLDRRIIGLPREITNVEAGIYDILNNGGMAGLPLATATSKGLTDEYACTIEGKNVLDAVLEIVEQSNYGIRANFDYQNRRHVIEVYAGVDRSYDSTSGGTVFSQEFGNLKSLVVTEDDDLYKNVAYVMGAANNDPRTVYYQYVAPDAGEHAQWRELLVNGENQREDESNADWQARQKQIGIDALAERKNALTFEVELSDGIFAKEYDVGDVVTCRSKRYGLWFDTRIMDYKYTCAGGVEKEEITLGDKPLDYVQNSILKTNDSSTTKPVVGGGTGVTVDALTNEELEAILK